MDFKRLQSTIFSNYNKGRFLLWKLNSNAARGRKMNSNCRVRRIVPGGGKGGEGQNKAR